MHTGTRAALMGLLLMTAGGPALALDCEQVKTLAREGKRASEIARELGITTPDVQACLAGAVQQPAPRTQAGRLPLAPRLSGTEEPVRRGPNQE